jgi:dTDP-4-amino-4,6-dideoxygalactose transaminase
MNPAHAKGAVAAGLSSAAPWPVFDDEMVAAAERVLRSGRVNYWTGEEGKSFEKEFAAYVGAPHAVAVANGTLALELALDALNIGPGDDVLVTPRTFVASASCIVSRGARPVFADVDRDSGCVTAATLRAALTPRTRAVIVVHLGGWPCDMDPILDWARERKLAVVEDVAQALGGTYKGRPLGTIGDVGCFSFCQDKILTTAGEGGMIVAREASTWEKLWSAKDHGKSYDACFRRSHPPGFRWLHETIGTNARMTEVQSAIGRVALRRLPGWLDTRRRHAGRMTDALSLFPALRVPAAPAGHAWYKHYAYARSQGERDRLLGALEAAGVPAFTGSCGEVYLEKAFEGFRPAHRLPVAKELGETSLMFLVHPTLTEAHVSETIRRISEVMAAGPG